VTGLATIRTSLEQCYDAIESLAVQMDPAQWHAQSLCPDWDMRGVIAHLGMMERVLAALTEADLARQSWTPVGPRSYGGFLEIRIFDFWVHERDISTPLGWPSDDAEAGAEIALAQVEGSIGYIVGKKIGLPDGASIVFHLTGPVTRDLAVVVDGRARAVGHVEHPDVELTTDTVTFIQLAAGRIDPQRQIDAGRVTWTGDTQLGERAARNLRFTI